MLDVAVLLLDCHLAGREGLLLHVGPTAGLDDLPLTAEFFGVGDYIVESALGGSVARRREARADGVEIRLAGFGRRVELPLRVKGGGELSAGEFVKGL